MPKIEEVEEVEGEVEVAADATEEEVTTVAATQQNNDGGDGEEADSGDEYETDSEYEEDEDDEMSGLSGMILSAAAAAYVCGRMYHSIM